MHKSQGSEFAAVVIPVSDLPEKLCYRNLLYTGVTRAKRLCILAGRPDTVARMTENIRQNLRYSCLADLLAQRGQPVRGEWWLWAEQLRVLVFPRRCPFCGRVLGVPHPLPGL